MTPARTICPAEAAVRLGKSRASILALITAGELPATDERLPGSKRPRYRIDPADLDRWRESRTVPVGAAVQPTGRRVVRSRGIVARQMERMAGRERKAVGT